MAENNRIIEPRYGLATAISMIVGICIGSGIFFKADNILQATNGDVPKSFLVFCIGAFCVIFSCLSISELAYRCDKDGGAIGYFEAFVSKYISGAFAWFQLFLYSPAPAAIVAWVSSIYTIQLFNLNNSLTNQAILSIFYILFFALMNYFSARLGGIFQSTTALIKLIPLIGMGIAGLLSNSPLLEPQGAVTSLPQDIHPQNLSWLSALAPTAFAFDGWIFSTAISKEIKNARRNVPLALVVGPLIVFIAYITYFFGIVVLAGKENILVLGDDTIKAIGVQLFGSMGGSILLSFVLISILGVLNGFMLSSMRLPQIIAQKDMLPQTIARKITARYNKEGLSPIGAVLITTTILFWLIVHFITLKTHLLGNSDISEIAIIFSYLTYILLHLKVISLYQSGEIKGKLRGIFVPVMAILGSFIILIGGFEVSPFYMPFFILFCSIICIIGYLVTKKNYSRAIG